MHDQAFFRRIAQQLFRIGRGASLELTLRERSGFLTRFARNEVHQNHERDTCHLSLRLVRGGRAARLEVTSLDPQTLRDAYENLQSLVRSRRLSAGEPLFPARQSYRPVRDFDPAVARENPRKVATCLSKVFRDVRKLGAEASGYFSAARRSVYIANSRGLEAFHRSSAMRFGLTIRKGEGIGYASQFQSHASCLKIDQVVATGAERAFQAQRLVRIRPGFYPVVIAPRALSEFVAPLLEDMSGRRVADRDSFFWGRRGKKIFSEHLTVEDDVYHPDQIGLPFDGVGLARGRLILIDKGVVKSFVYDQKAARDLQVRPTGHTAGALQASTMPVNAVIREGEESVDEMLDHFREALFIPHLWYHQITNPNHLLATGLVKGSALLWRRGGWVGGAPHVRYLVSVPEILSRIVARSRERQVIKDREYGASVFPYLAVEGFRII